jgi:protein-tyrosine phosphatase
MIDIHCHILPNVDDGAKNIENSKVLLKEEIENNNEYVILTPHQNKDNLNKEMLENQFEEFSKNIDLNVKLMLGCELYYYEGMEKDLKDGKILTLNNSKYVLIEFSTRSETKVSDVVYEISSNGFVPIVAHVERYPYLKNDDYLDIVKNGGLIQVNSRCFTTKEHKKKLKFLLKNKLVSFIASDCHDEVRRPCDFEKAKAFVKKKYKDQYTKLFETIPDFV